MIKHRCPWCGEFLPVKMPIRQILWTTNKPDVCPYCKKPYTGHANFKSAVILLVALVTAYFIAAIIDQFDVNSMIYFILVVVGCILLPVLLVGTYQLPYDRSIKKQDQPHTPLKKYATVSIAWARHDQEGLLLPRFQMKNGEIFPACFLDAEGTPISTALCVALEKIHWTDTRHCTCQISLVLDEAPADQLLHSGNQIYLYHNYREIAKGSIQ